jgi:hypothetical protein
VLWGVVVASSAWAEEAQLHGIPYKPDPPPAIDGRLEEWEGVPNASLIRTKEQVVYGGKAWTSPQDLSAKVWLAWRDEYLYLAADVTDDRHVQKGRGVGMWRGDHIEFYLDATPDAEPQRTAWGQGQIHLGFSPGSLTQTGDPLSDIPPEAVVFTPEGMGAEGVLVAAQKTEKGYALEVAVPWTLIARLAKLPELKAHAGMPLGFEVGISDTDGPEPAQEKLMTILTAPWGHTRNRLIAAALAPSDGKAPPVVRGFELAKGAELPPQQKTELRFQGLTVPSGQEGLITLQARLATPRASGYTAALRLRLNGTELDNSRLVNRQREETRVTGQTMTRGAGALLNTSYAPDFEASDRSSAYALQSGAKLCQFEMRVTDLLRAGENRLVIENGVAPEVRRTLVVAAVRLEVRTPSRPKARRSAPVGPLEVIIPRRRRQVDYRLTELADAALELAVNGERFRIESQFSTPQPAWVKGSNHYFDFQRKIERLDEAIVVHDTFTNRTDANLPLMHRHRVLMPGGLKRVWLAGLSPSGLAGSSSDPAQPTSYGITARSGVGLMAIDDVSQVHVANFSAADHVGWADDQCVLKPGAVHAVRWAILPTDAPDYWAMVNAARRLRGVNFTLDGSFAFLRAYPKKLTGAWTDRQFTDFIRFKDAKYVCDGYEWPSYKGRFPHGTVFQTIDYSYFRQQMARLRKLVPESQHLMYFHCFLDVLDEAPQKYADARLLTSSGAQADYGRPYDRIFVPTTSNSFGRDIAKNVELILGPLPKGFGCQGVFWDEFAYSRYQYHYDDFSRATTPLPWDGVSGDIDPRSMRITHLKSSVTLISQPFRLALAQRILRQHLLIGNGQPHTETMVKLHFPRFVETGSISNCAHTHLYTPIALGDHLTERSELDAYHVMLRALDFGCVYYWYNDLNVIPSHRHLTRYMFPITPLELHEGYLLGRERIVTNRSGLFGWGDQGRHEVHVFDDQGREVPGFKTRMVVKDGMTLSELRLPEDYSAAIVRGPGFARDSGF